MEMDYNEMKQQLRMLQDKLDKQVEINERQLHNAIGEGLSSLRHRDVKHVILCVVVAFLVPSVLYIQGTSHTFNIITLVFLLLNAAWRYYLKFDSADYHKLDVVSSARQLIKYKERHRVSLLIGIPLALVWVCFYLREQALILGANSRQDFSFLLIGAAVGLVVGFLIGYFRCYRPTMQAADKILSQINELQQL